MIGEHVQRFDIGTRSQIPAQTQKIFLLISDTRNYYMADPYGDALLLQICLKGHYRLLRLAAELFVLVGVNVLYIKEHQVCYRSQPVKLLQKGRGIGAEGNAGGIEAGVDAAFFCFCKKFCDKADLH